MQEALKGVSAGSIIRGPFRLSKSEGIRRKVHKVPIKDLTMMGRQKIGSMQIIQSQPITKQFFAPVNRALKTAINQRSCVKLTDSDWIEMGARRVLGDYRSGREFLQEWNLGQNGNIAVEHFFESANSQRRLRLLKEVNTAIAASMPVHKCSGTEVFKDFEKFEIYAGDGHYIEPSAHEKKVQGKKRPCGHFYSLNLKTRAMTHLSASDLKGGLKKADHDMSALKRLGGRVLRQGAKVGRKVLYVWDPAGIAVKQWGYWKQQNGVYFLSRATANMGFIEIKSNEWEAADAVNMGIVSDKIVTTLSSSERLRWIVYTCPESGEAYEFITTEMTIRPGLLAWLYKSRWDVEKIYDTFKNKFGQTKAWGGSREAKEMQAQFICLTHNLTILLEDALAIEDEKETSRAERRADEREAKAKEHQRSFAPQYRNPQKRSQIAAKFIRWLRHCLAATLPMTEAIHALRRVYAIF